MRKITLYIIDDEEEMVTTLKQLFKGNRRYKVYGFSSATEVRETAKRVQPQVVICDYIMPECEGIDLLRELKQSYPKMRSILLTGQVFDKAIVDGLEEGVVNYYFSKPCNHQNLEETVSRVAREIAKEL